MLIITSSCLKQHSNQLGGFPNKYQNFLLLKHSGLFNFSAHLHDQQEIHNATHTCDLQQRQNGEWQIYLNVDHHQMGIGGDLSWMPCVYPEYLLSSRVEYESG